jgi:hypothetical protein
MVIDGLFGTERVLSVLGGLYNVIIASGDIFALVIAVAILVFLFRRLFLHVKRFSGIEMKHISHLDANVALTMILLLMISLLGMNTFYIQSATHAGHELVGFFPVSRLLASRIDAGGHNEFWHSSTGGCTSVSSLYLPITCLTPSISTYSCPFPMFS